MEKIKRCGILVGGGPAPGINSAIRAATIKLRNEGVTVVGIYDGFQHLMQRDTGHAKELNIEDVSQIHFKGGSVLRTSRANPVTMDSGLENVFYSLEKLNINALVTIGGDDTFFSAIQLEKLAGGRIQFVHIPKTIDNDLNLPHGIRTFGFASARHFGCVITKSLLTDAACTSRWYLVTAMGRKAGHLAFGIAKSSGATLCVIPEEFREKHINLHEVVDILMGAVIKRRAGDRAYGVAILAEGLAERLSVHELEKMGNVEFDQHGHIRLAEIDLGGVLKDQLKNGLKDFGIDTTVVHKNIGYELRSLEPIPFDIEYTKDLGFSAATYLLEGKSGDMTSIQNGRLVPLSFEEMIDPNTGRPKIRMVDINTLSYEVGYEYMIRLKKDDFLNPEFLTRLAKVINVSPVEFKKRFGYLVGL